MALYRNTIAVRSERAAELRAAICEAQRELEALDIEADRLSAQWQDAVAWVAAPSAQTRFRRGMAMGLGVVLVAPLLLVTLLATAGLPPSAIAVLFR